MYLFSKSTLSFYPIALLDAYNNADSLPYDTVSCADDEAEEFVGRTPPEGYELGADINGRPAWVEVDYKASLSSYKKIQHQVINKEREKILDAGIPYVVNGANDVIQTRLKDRINLMALRVEAEELRALGETGTVMEFRGKNNTNHAVTPQEMINIANAVLAHIKAIYAESWQLKDAIETASTVEEVRAINW
jgi:hypothetical protein